MELKHLLSIATVALTALGAVLYSMGVSDPRLAVGLWMAAMASLIVTDFLGVIRMPRTVGTVLMWCVLIVYLWQFLRSWDGRSPVGHSTDWQLQSVVNVLIFLQMILLFQEKDVRAYGWLTVMSLLQVVVAARYRRGVDFGSLLIVYAILGIFVLSLLALFGHRKGAQRDSRKTFTGRSRKGTRPHAGPLQERKESARWPLADIEPDFASTPSSSGRAGLVPEYFGRLSLIIVGGFALATVVFYAAPRPRIPYKNWGDTRRTISVVGVGFNDQIELGRLGSTLESREEVMRVRFLDEATREPYPLYTPEVYLRGATLVSYSANQWRRLPSEAQPEGDSRLPAIRDEPLDYAVSVPEQEKAPALQIGPPVIQQSTLEPYLGRWDVFYLWPIVEKDGSLHYEPQSERLFRRPPFSLEPQPGEFTCELVTTGLADGVQPALVPARFRVQPTQLLQMPGDGSSLPRLRAMAARWLHDSGLAPSQQKEIAEYFERQFSSSGHFHYALQPVERDDSIDAIEDFVSNHPSGHCEYFATALALMLRSQGIPSRVILGYRCDEYDPRDHVFQVRQLHAHAWVEAFLAPARIPQPLRQENPKRWTHGGWLRLDATPGDDIGSTAANSTVLGAWQARLHALQHYWERYIADMDHAKQERSIYTPIRDFTSGLLSWETWRSLFVGGWHALARMLQSGIMGKLAAALLLTAGAAVLVVAVNRLARLAKRLWRRFIARRFAPARGTRSSVEFYRRFEQVAAQRGLRRRSGQTPREFAQSAGARLAKLSGRPELCDCATEVTEAFYRVRFGRQELDAAAAEAVRKAIEELKAGAAASQQSNPKR